VVNFPPATDIIPLSVRKKFSLDSAEGSFLLVAKTVRTPAKDEIQSLREIFKDGEKACQDAENLSHVRRYDFTGFFE
jgi:hypothetical protein